jgi:hypothetical protein|tara:strand:+ start:354 stop:950 length:597 start_codon:yes stop_codon:yes gene_type:complete
MANEQNHELKTFGAQFLIDTGNERMTHAGKTVYFIQGMTKDKIKNNISFHETGLSRYYTEKTLQVESGYLGASNVKDNISYRQVVHKGDYTLNVDLGAIRLRAKNIILEAENDLTLKASNKIQIGDKSTGATKEIELKADKVHAITTNGNIADILGTSFLKKAFSGSYANAGALGLAASGLQAAAPLVGKFKQKFLGR